MYLKTLELQGFKSFADKTKIELGGGIAAIVGPNGSGKSNIVEAIQWVLGEQSAKTLRGHKMQDIIFNGTKNRKPLGVAEISIVLDNSDHSLDIDFTEVKEKPEKQENNYGKDSSKQTYSKDRGKYTL